MEKEVDYLENRISEISELFLEKSKDKDILIASHFDTDGITSATIAIKALKKLDINFSVKIFKSLEEKQIQELPKDKLILFLDLGSGVLDYIEKSKLKDVFIIDHHEVIQSIPENVFIINPELNGKEKLSASSLTYLFFKQIDPSNKELAKLAVLGMIGDLLERNIDRLNNEILNDGEILKKRGLLIYPSTRPINRVLEFNSNPYIPGVTGDIEGVLNLLREINLKPHNGKYKTLLELDEREMSNLVTAIMLRNPKSRTEEIIGDIFLIKMFGKLEDARELSAMVNACSRMGESETAIQLCMELNSCKKNAETLTTKYKRSLLNGLELANKQENQIKGKGYVIINAQDKISDTIIGTIASILSNSAVYEEGTIIITMAHREDKIKISTRIAGRNGKNLRELLNRVITNIGGDVGGHEFAAGCIINKEQEEEFLKAIRKTLDIEVVKIQKDQ